MGKKKHPEHVNHERWLVSYADFITLLFAFFVVLFASSQSDKKKQSQMAAVMQNAFTPLGTFDAYRVVPAVDYESDGKLSESATGTVIWVSADNRRLPLRAESQAFIGKIRADLIQASG